VILGSTRVSRASFGVAFELHLRRTMDPVEKVRDRETRSPTRETRVLPRNASHDNGRINAAKAE